MCTRPSIARGYGVAIPRVSVIIPAHNSAVTLPETLASVLAQTYDDWDCIVADDASTDDTLVVAQAAGPRVRSVHSATNVGPAGARNLAIGHAGGELLAFLDADDVWEPEYLERQVAAFDAAGPRVGVVAANAYFLTAAGRAGLTYAEVHGRAANVGLTELLRSNRIFISALVPKAVVDEVGGFSTECWGSEDHDLWLRVVQAGYRVIATDEPLVGYRVRDASVSANALSMARTSQTTYRRALERGGLDRRQRLIANRHLLLQNSVEQLELLRCARGAARRVRLALRSLPVVLTTVALHPDRWLAWVRLIARRR